MKLAAAHFTNQKRDKRIHKSTVRPILRSYNHATNTTNEWLRFNERTVTIVSSLATISFSYAWKSIGVAYNARCMENGQKTKGNTRINRKKNKLHTWYIRKKQHKPFRRFNKLRFILWMIFDMCWHDGMLSLIILFQLLLLIHFVWFDSCIDKIRLSPMDLNRSEFSHANEREVPTGWHADGH